MNSSIYRETSLRGTADFPIDYHRLDVWHPRYQMQTHYHKDIELILVTDGFLDARIGDEMYSLKKGEGLYVPGGIAHGALAVDCEYECIVFSSSAVFSTQRIRSLIKNEAVSVVKFKDNADFERLFELLREAKKGYEFEVIGRIHRIAPLFLKSDRTISSSRADKIKPAINYIRKNFASNIGLEELAAECSMSPNYFCRIFREVSGQTPVEYITMYRLELAREKLLSGTKVTDTAYDCGFNDLSYFIHVFKKNIGVSPKRYQQGK